MLPIKGLCQEKQKSRDVIRQMTGTGELVAIALDDPDKFLFRLFRDNQDVKLGFVNEAFDLKPKGLEQNSRLRLVREVIEREGGIFT